MYAKHPLLAITALGSSVAALGINCRGSSNCAGAPGNIQGVLSAVEAVAQDRQYYDGQHVGCANNLCAFFQNGASGTAGDVKNYIQQLIDHGCTKCGSVPTQPGNDVSTGELTINWVVSP